MAPLFVRAWVFAVTVLMCACATQSPTRTAPPKPFASDGCSLFPDGDYRTCCEVHDYAYWCGGNKRQRRDADRSLAACVRDHGHRFLDRVMYLGVRLAGGPWLPTPWRWGFGWPFGKGYTSDPYVNCPAVDVADVAADGVRVKACLDHGGLPDDEPCSR